MRRTSKCNPITFNVDNATRKAFFSVCERNKTTAVAMLRRFIDFVIASEIQQYKVYQTQSRSEDYEEYFKQSKDLTTI